MATMDRSCRVQVVKIRLDAREKGWPGFRFGASEALDKNLI